MACGPSLHTFPYLAPAPGSDHGTSFAPLGDALVVAIARGQRDRAPTAAPIALTTSDGRGLALERIEVEAVITGPLALTELHLTFRNPEPRELEGRFALTLPPGAAVSRFAMKNADWREAEIVPREQARQVYESYLHRKVDPALLEHSAGNTFNARVFPIAASATKELVVAYSQEVSAAAPYRVHLAGLPRVGALRWTITADGQRHDGDQRDVVPADLAVDTDPGDAAVVAGEAFVARVVPPAAGAADPLGDLVILVDTSASRAAVLARTATVVRGLVDDLARRAPDTRVAVHAFDQGVDLLAEGPAIAVAPSVAPAVLARGALGASDLGAALRSIPPGARVVVVTDGVATTGERDPGALAAIVRAAGVARLDVVTVGGVEDRAVLQALTAAGARGGAIIDGERPGLLAALERGMLGDVRLAVRGATWSWPASLAGLAAGQPVVIAGVRRGAGPVEIIVTDASGPRTVAVPVVAAAPALVERAVAQAQIAKLGASLRDLPAGDPARARGRAEITALGLRHRLVTPETSLLVLETDADYARFCLARHGLSDLLTVDTGAIRVVDRSPDGTGGVAVAGCTPGEAQPPNDAAASPTVTATTGAVVGVVRDAGSGDRLAGATVVASTGGGQRAEISDDQGRFTFSLLDPGEITLTVYFSDRETARRVTVRAGQVTDLGGAGGWPPLVAPPLDPAPAPEPVHVPLPPRTFGAIHGTAAGGQDDAGAGEASGFVGTSSVENTYVIDGVNAGIAIDTRAAGAEVITISHRVPMIDLSTTTVGITLAPDHPPVNWNAVRDRHEPPPPPPAYTGRFLTVMQHLRAGRRDAALADALAWQTSAPTELAAIVALGEALEARGAVGLAARAYGSIIDLWPGQAELVRYAAERLDRVGAAGRPLALDAYRRALADRPDHVTTYRLLAWALVRAGRFDEATVQLERAIGRARRDSVRALLRDELGVVAAAWVRAEPARRAALAARLARRGAAIADRPSLRLVLSWETDANDVDLHVRDRAGDHAWYSQRALASGGRLADDLTDGYGPEVFTIVGAPRGGPYRVQVHYYNRGAMGLGLGTLQIVRHDGDGQVTVDDRPFVIMNDGAYADLGTVD